MKILPIFFFMFMGTDFIKNYFYWNLKFASNTRWHCTKILYKYYQQAQTWNPIFFSSFFQLSSVYPSLVTHIRTRCSFCPIILAFFPFSFAALMVCIVMIVIRSQGVCSIQVVTQDADMAENINFYG